MNKSRIRILFRSAAGNLNNRPMSWGELFSNSKLFEIRTIKIIYL